MKINLSRFDTFFYGLLPGLILPIGFMWLYLQQYYPTEVNFVEQLKLLYPGALMGKLLMLSIFPNLIIFFVFYKMDVFKLATGIMTGAMPYLISSFFML